jgi:uncharacterized membrane protein YfcA
MYDLSLLWLCLTALVAGAVNAVAGGGTLLTFPALIGALTPLRGAALAAVIANATSTAALVPGSMASAWGYRHKIQEARRWLLLLVAPSLVGGTVGSLLVTRLPARYFATLVPWLILLAATLLLVDSLMPRKTPHGSERNTHSLGAIAALTVFQFLVSVYGGYFGAGIGILMLSSLALMGIGDINRMNAVKTVLTACINGTSVIVFMVDNKIEWSYALPMAAFAILGGYLGARLALRIHPRRVRWIVIAIGFGLAAYFFYQQRTAAG